MKFQKKKNRKTSLSSLLFSCWLSNWKSINSYSKKKNIFVFCVFFRNSITNERRTNLMLNIIWHTWYNRTNIKIKPKQNCLSEILKCHTVIIVIELKVNFNRIANFSFKEQNNFLSFSTSLFPGFLVNNWNENKCKLLGIMLPFSLNLTNKE